MRGKTKSTKLGKARKGKINNFIDTLNYITNSRNFIFFVIGLFALSLVLGVIFPNVFGDIIIDIIKELLKKTEGLNFIELFIFIFFNNLKTSLIGLLSGLLFGVFPMFLAVSNGYLLGFVMNVSFRENGVVDLWKIFPHGIFEMPAFFISLGLGVKLGYSLLFTRKMFKNDIKMSLKTFVYIIIPLLLIAGMIETILIFMLK